MRNQCFTLYAGLALAALSLAGCGDSTTSSPYNPPVAVNTSFVDPTATLTGSVTLGSGVYIAPFARV